MILGGIAAFGETVLSRIYHIDRGYENIEFKLSRIGVDIKELIIDTIVTKIRYKIFVKIKF